MNRFHRWFCKSAFWRGSLHRHILPWALEGLEFGDRMLEIGPGPGLATEFLAARFPGLTAVELDAGFAQALGRRMPVVRVVRGDGTLLPFRDGVFRGAVCFTMLHHVPSKDLQDRLLSEVRRVLRPGGIFAGTDSTLSTVLQLIHYRDTLNTVDPNRFGERLQAAGFEAMKIESNRHMFRFSARRPAQDR